MTQAQSEADALINDDEFEGTLRSVAWKRQSTR